MPKNNLIIFQNFTNASMAGTLTSPVTDIRYLDNIGVQLVFTGSPTGTFGVQVSIDYNAATENPGDWTPLTFTTPPVASGGPGNVYIDLNQLSAPYIQITYTPTGGTGTLNGYITGKAV